MNRLITQALNNIRRYCVVSIDSVGIMVFALFLIGIFMLLVLNLNNFINEIKDRVEIAVFLIDTDTVADSAKIEREKAILKMQKNIKDIENVASIVFIDKTKALEEFTKDPDLKKEIDMIDYNPLPDSFTIKLKDNDSKSVAEFVAKIENHELTQDIVYGADTIKNLERLLKYVYIIGALIAGFSSILIFIILKYIIKISFHYRAKEFRLWHYLGISSFFIGSLLIIEGITIGIISSAISLALIMLFYKLISFTVANIIFFPNIYFLYITTLAMFLGIITNLSLLKKSRTIS